MDLVSAKNTASRVTRTSHAESVVYNEWNAMIMSHLIVTLSAVAYRLWHLATNTYFG
jgi:hypothetical protein